MWLLEVTGVLFDVFDIRLFGADDSVRFDTESVVSDVTGDGDGIPMTTAARSWGGASGRSEWLNFVSQGAGPMAPPIRTRLRTGVFFQNGGIRIICIVNTLRESVGVLRVTGSLLRYLQVPRFHVDALKQIVCVVGHINRTVPQNYIVDEMASENSQPGADRKGIDFEVHVQIPWNAPESVVTLDSPGVVVLDTTCVPDVLGLRTRYADAETV